MLRGQIVFIDETNNEYRVFIPDIHTPNLSPNKYPKLVSNGCDTKNIHIPLHKDDWIWVDFEKNDYHYPFMIKSYFDKLNVRTEDKSSNDIIHIINETGNGIHISSSGNNIKINVDGDINISVNGVMYKSLLQQLNEMNEAISELQEFVVTKYNLHVHTPPTNPTAVQGIITKFNYMINSFFKPKS